MTAYPDDDDQLLGSDDDTELDSEQTNNPTVSAAGSNHLFCKGERDG